MVHKDFKKEYNYSYTGIQKTLYWWYEIKKNDLSKANDGIGIVPFIYKDACDYFYRIYEVYHKMIKNVT